MEVRGRNGKWLRAGNGRTVRVGWVDIVHEFCPRICGRQRGMEAFVIVDVIECHIQVGHHKRVGSEDRSRNRRGLVNGKEGMNGGELAADFFFLNIEETSDMLNHLLVGECQFVAGGTVRRRRGDDIRGIAYTVHGRGEARGNENGGG